LIWSNWGKKWTPSTRISVSGELITILPSIWLSLRTSFAEHAWGNIRVFDNVSSR
jgi:hypothetical protein